MPLKSEGTGCEPLCVGSIISAPKRKRHHVRKLVEVPKDCDINRLSARTKYIGSPEHKEQTSFAGTPRPRRADATICDPALNDPKKLTKWLREGMRAGNVGTPWEGGFPRYVWVRKGEKVYEAGLVNRGNGEYKGWELQPDEFPKGMK